MPFIVSDPVTLLIWAILGYLFGSIPSGMILARVMNLGNLREIGSGNIGATNVLRTGNKAAAALTLLFDAAKAMIPLLLARHFAGEDAAQLAALAAYLGHCFPVWLKFRGGKGVATSFGAMLGAFPILTWPVVIAFGLWALALFITRYMGVASCIGAIALPVAAACITLFSDRSHAEALPLYLITGVLALLVVAKHKGNLQRTIARTEPRFTLKRSA